MGTVSSFISESYPPAPTFTEKDVPDLTGKVMIVTGGNTGIGREVTRVLLLHDAKVYIACRSTERANAAIDELKKETEKDNIHLLQLDLASFSSIRKAAEEFKSKETKLDVLYNNAGVMAPPIDQLTEEGFDLQFGTNVVGHFLFTSLLLPSLLSAAASDEKARVVTTSSFGHHLGPKGCLEWETLKPGEWKSPGDKLRRKLGPDKLYYQSKCGSILLAKELARRYGDHGIVSISLNPGTIQSELGRHWGWLQKFTTSLFVKLRPVSLGAINQLYAGTSPEAKELNGKYIIPWARVGEPRADEQNAATGEELWKWLERQTASSGPEAS